MVGRRQNSGIYSELQFTLIKLENRKYAGLCGVCEKPLTNTSVSRLKAHRNKCRPPNEADLNSTPLSSTYLSERKIKKRKHSTRSSDSENQNSDNIYSEIPEPPKEEPEELWEEIIFHKTSATDDEDEEEEEEKEAEAEVDKDFDAGVASSDSSLQSPSAKPLSSTIRSYCLSSERGYSQIRPLTSGISSSKSSKKTIRKRISAQGKNQKLTDFVDTVTSEEIDHLNESVANFFFGCNIPLSVIDSDHFRTLVTDLRPAYGPKLPSRKALSTTLLENAYKRCIQKTSESLNLYAVLLIHGWKNSSSNSKTVVSMLYKSTGLQAFLNSWDITAEAETEEEKLTQILKESIKLAKKLYNTTVYAVVSDNLSSVPKTARTIEIWHSNCNSHIANLLAEDVADDDCTKKVIAILRDFKNCDLEKVFFDQKGSRIKLPADTRWCSYRESYSCLIKNLHIMKWLIVNDPNFRRIKENVKSLVFDDDFTDQVKQYILLFDPICTFIYRTQSPDCSAAEATHLWFHLKFPQGFSHLNPRLEHRRTMAQNIYALAAFYLHPFYHNDSVVQFSETQMNDVRDFLIDNLDGEGLASLHQFLEKVGIFKTLLEKNLSDPIAFWNMAQVKHPNLSDFAIKLLQLPASSAQIERVFSNWPYVHSQIRNRVAFDRSKKLLHVYYALKIRDSNNSDEY